MSDVRCGNTDPPSPRITNVEITEYGLAIAAIEPNEVDHECGDDAYQKSDPDPHAQPSPSKQNQP